MAKVNTSLCTVLNDVFAVTIASCFVICCLFPGAIMKPEIENDE